MTIIKSKHLFKSTSKYYSKFRLGHPDEFFAHLVDRFFLDGNGRLLDLGCGTGQIAIHLSKHFKDVVAIDVSSEMIKEAKISSAKFGANNIEWIVTESEKLLTLNIGTFDMVTIGNAFHHFDRPCVLDLLDKIVNKEGVVIIVGSGESLQNNKTEWKKMMKPIIKKYVGEKLQVKNALGNKSLLGDEKILASSPFRNVEKFELPYTINWTIDSILGHLYSTSYCSENVLRDKKEAFEKEMRKKLLEYEPSSIIKEEVTLFAYLAKKN